ncbi:MAG: hypothetical protein AAGI38_14500 [Bacteroidota bacterium]
MPGICLLFRLEMPLKVHPYSFFDLGVQHEYIHQAKLLADFQQDVEQTYVPFFEGILPILKNTPLCFSLSIQGLALRNLFKSSPRLSEVLKDTTETGSTGLLAEPVADSLAFLHDRKEFSRQLESHGLLLHQHLRQTPYYIRNTQLLYHNFLGYFAAVHGYQGIITSGVDRFMHGRSPHFLYQPPHTPKVNLLMIDQGLSNYLVQTLNGDHNREQFLQGLESSYHDDWVVLEVPLLALAKKGEQVVTSQIEFFSDWVGFVESSHAWEFVLPENISQEVPKGTYNCPSFNMPAHGGDQIGNFYGNALQAEAIETVFGLRDEVLSTEHYPTIRMWEMLQGARFFHWMGYHENGQNPFGGPQRAYAAYMLMLADFQQTLQQRAS